MVILGKHGFLATNLLAYFRGRGIPAESIGRHEINLLRRDAASDLAGFLRERDTLIITSALTPDRGRDITILLMNLRMAENLCDALQKRMCRHVIYISSEAVYDANKIPIDEESTREPTDLYALMHTAREMMLSAVLKQAQTPFCIVRPVSAYGTGDTHDNYGPNRFVHQAFQEGRIVLFGKGEERRSHVHIDDIARLIGLCVERTSEGPLNIAPPDSVTYLRLAHWIQRTVPAKVELDFQPRTVPPIHRPYRMTQIFRILYNLGRPVGPIVHRTYSPHNLRLAFPRFRFIPVQEGIQRYVLEYGNTVGIERGLKGTVGRDPA